MRKLLIIDDSPDLLEVMQHVVKYLGYTVQTLPNSKQVNERLESFQPDLVILDVHLPWIDGRELCKKLKTDASTKDIPVLLFSAAPKDLLDYKDYFADDILEKPFNLHTLAEKIKQLLNVSSTTELI